MRLAGISLSLRLSCACLLLTVVCDVGRLGGGKVHRLLPLTQRMSGLAAAPAAARLRVSLRSYRKKDALLNTTSPSLPPLREQPRRSTEGPFAEVARIRQDSRQLC